MANNTPIRIAFKVCKYEEYYETLRREANLMKIISEKENEYATKTGQKIKIIPTYYDLYEHSTLGPILMTELCKMNMRELFKLNKYTFSSEFIIRIGYRLVKFFFFIVIFSNLSN